MNGVKPAIRRLVWDRDNGICGWCGRHCPEGIGDLQHRRARGSGGSKRIDTNLPGNLVLLHRECHTNIESRRDDAIARGFNVPQHLSPAAVPVLVKAGPSGAWVLIDTLGGREQITAGEAETIRNELGLVAA